MSAWPGGPCPQCGEDMPENLIHCQVCRALLNPELEHDSVEIPVFIPLQEIDSMSEVTVRGHYIECPTCVKELRINSKYLGQHVQCKFCNGSFDYTKASIRTVAVYSACPHCKDEIRAATKYLGLKVACKHCNGKLSLLEANSEPATPKETTE